MGSLLALLGVILPLLCLADVFTCCSA